MAGFDSSKKNFDNLTGNPSNYTAWSENMESYLKTRREWLPVVGRFPEPEHADVNNPTRQERLDRMQWRETMDSAAGTIFLCIDESQRDHVRDCRNDPEATWDRLKELHQQRKAGPRFAAYDAFFNIRKEENESLTDLTGQVSRAMAQIRTLRPSHFGLQQLDEELQCMALIRALPAEYNSFVDSLFLLDKITIAALRAAFHNRENQTQLRESSTTASAVAMKALHLSATTICNWCSRVGHAEDNCYTKKSSQQRDQSRALSKVNGKGKPKTEKVASAEIKEESASLASINPSSPASSDWNTDTGASRMSNFTDRWVFEGFRSEREYLADNFSSR